MANDRAEGPRVAVVGAGGVVGGQLVELIRERGLSFSTLRTFASPSDESADAEGEERDTDAERLENFRALDDFDLAFLATPAQIASEIAGTRPRATLIDLSGGCERHVNGSLVAPGFTARQDLVGLKRRGAIFVTPHPIATVAATILRALDVRRGLVSAVGMLGASSFGRRCVDKAISQSAAALNGVLDLAESETRFAFNLFPSPARERFQQMFARQLAALIGQAPEIAIQLVQVPVLHGVALSLCLPPAATVDDRRARLREAPGLLLEEGGPAGLVDVVNQDAVVVSISQEKPAWIVWCAFDNARVAALAALWVAENLASTDSAER
jgi:aspartate-semialdehyde dehydrogenase